MDSGGYDESKNPKQRGFSGIWGLLSVDNLWVFVEFSGDSETQDIVFSHRTKTYGPGPKIITPEEGQKCYKLLK